VPVLPQGRRQGDQTGRGREHVLAGDSGVLGHRRAGNVQFFEADCSEAVTTASRDICAYACASLIYVFF
jgi:hypothetical protein